MSPADHGACNSVEAAFQLLSKKWVGLIIHTLLGGELHFCDLERALPSLSARVLSVRVRELEEAGLVERRVETGPPVRVLYKLTPRGLGLEPVMRSIAAWATAPST
jgi:DNA-binding HxlR family transcriptional regulator